MQTEHYGIHLAKVVRFPEHFLDVAETVSTELQRQVEVKKQNSQHQEMTRSRALVLNLKETLRNMGGGDMDDEALGSLLVHLQREFVAKMDDVEASSGTRAMSDYRDDLE